MREKERERGERGGVNWGERREEGVGDPSYTPPPPPPPSVVLFPTFHPP